MSTFEDFIGESPGIMEIKEEIMLFAKTDVPVFITGETGTGKLVVAKYLHEYGGRKDKDFFSVNCASIPSGLSESALFGHTDHAFTGAGLGKKGYFDAASGGTLFLDEMTKLPREMVSNLLTVIEDHLFIRVGGVEKIYTDARVVAAGSNPGEVPEDLYYRFTRVLELPPLRNRVNDIPLLVDYFSKKFSKKYDKTSRIGDDKVSKLMDYPWPGNVRQLENSLERFFITGNIDFQEHRNPRDGLKEHNEKYLIGKLYEIAKEIGTKGLNKRLCADMCACAIKEAGGDLDKACEILGIKQSTLYLYKNNRGLF